ncbi:DgyrCDS701 [Dimorphilus gyrociliatus]|uniref:DgyrCDS701 n=1 Tax=Dimorphilus gyrociliatus TaxID=2664684 RepID=A0A7I8V563_9ANNE|nr:DgyrCDS701 [Dimorphilus gyrociliatus]
MDSEETALLLLDKRKKKNDHPYTSANFLSKFFLCWLNDLFRESHKRRLTDKDVFPLLPEDEIESHYDEIKNYKPSKGHLRVFKAFIWVLSLQKKNVFLFLICHIIAVVIVAIVALIFWAIGLSLSFYEGVQRQRINRATDKRIEMMGEIIRGMKIIKMNVWEKAFGQTIAKLRKFELSCYRKAYFFRSLYFSLFITCAKILFLTTFFSYWKLQTNPQTLSLSTTFMAMSLLNVLYFLSLSIYTNNFSYFIQVHESLQRILDFIQEPDFVKREIKPNGNVLYVNNLSASWQTQENDYSEYTIQNITFSIEEGQVLIITGEVGSGKTALLQSLMGELSLSSNTQFNNSFQYAYAAQEPWIFHGTIKENILFHSDYDEERYKTVLNVCCLEKDLERFPNGDLSFVGEKGVTLSGGQRSRISLARCVYKEADVYLLDDPLSAVDLKVGKGLFYDCIRTFLKDKIVILVTHHSAYFERADKILILNKGKTIFLGDYENFQKLENDINLSYLKEEDSKISVDKFLIKDKGTEENEETFRVNLSDMKAYRTYFTSGKNLLLISTIFFSLLINPLKIYSDYLLSTLTTNSDKDKTSQETIFITYLCLLFAIFIVDFLRNYLALSFTTSAGENLHNKLFQRVLNSKLDFFSKTPSGNILNRFSRDLLFIDDKLAVTFHWAIFVSFDIVVYMILSIVAVYWMIFVIIPIVIVTMYLAYYAIRLTKVVKWLEAAKRSPFYSHISDTLDDIVEYYEWLVRQITEFENYMTSVTRIIEYSNLELEKYDSNRDIVVPSDWPKSGQLEFRNVYLYYDGCEKAALQNINLTFQHNQKIGVIGRTGSGKSSLIAALLRLYEPQGEIVLDGIDLTKLPLGKARSGISVIPQEPFLFNGSIRKNIDPFDEFEDEEIWTALHKTQSVDKFAKSVDKLDFPIQERGNNLSVGEKQLVCLARAMLSKPRILVMDEVTANIDEKIDKIIQETLMEHFTNCTKIVIAHRLKTIIDSDVIVVLHDGVVRHEKHKSAYSSANFLSKFFLCWLNGFFRESQKRRITEDDVSTLLPEDKIETQYDYINYFYFFGTVIGAKNRATFSTMVYSKILRISTSSTKDFTNGHITNLLSSDVEKIPMTDAFLYILSVPVLSVAILLILSSVLGWIVTLIALATITFWAIGLSLSCYEGVQRQRINRATDKRIEMIGEIIRGMKIIKMNVWEKVFGQTIAKLRKFELSCYRKAYFFRSLYFSLFITSAKILFLTTFLSYWKLSSNPQPLTLSTTFTVMSFLNALIYIVMSCYTTKLSDFIQVHESLQRILDFIQEPDFVKREIKPNGNVLYVNNLSASWQTQENDYSEYTIQNITFSIEEGQVLIITGEVGSGKTALLQSLMGELSLSSNTQFNNSFQYAYAAQEPWIFHGTIKENILFHSDYDEERYKTVLNVCCLEKDLERFPNGDLSFVGEKGVTLSGGQRSRISLARCVYKEADVYLLDDPLSAVDLKVGKGLFYDCIRTFLKDKIVILVTHHSAYFERADKILILNKGKTIFLGDYENFQKLENDMNLSYLKEEMNNPPERLEAIEESPEEGENSLRLGLSDMKTYRTYFTSGNVFFLITAVALSIVINPLRIYSDYLLTTLTTNSDKDMSSQKTVFITYLSLLFAIFVVDFLRNYSALTFTTSVGENLHNKLFQRVLNSKLDFFSKTPSGNILNRFSRDLLFIDDKLAITFHWGLYVSFDICINMILSIVAVYWMAFAIIPIFVATAFVTFYGLKLTKMMKWLEAAKRSPFYSHISDTLDEVVEYYEWLVRQITEFENYMTSVTRIIEYSNLELEKYDSNHDIVVPSDWPKSGQLEFRNVYLYYDGCEKAALQNINLTFQHNQKIGVIGRTGSGKSSLIAALLRLYEPQGEIVLDGIDLTKLPLGKARSGISVIPQEPFLFNGSIRKNIDPFDEFEDEEIWTALYKTQLVDKFAKSVDKLNFSIQERGNNLSVGEKQLVCLARAMLSKPRILVMDEVTANIDEKIDKIIQETLMEHFTNCTKIVIAHRLKTIIDSDVIVVLHDGVVRKVDVPDNIITESGCLDDIEY